MKKVLQVFKFLRSSSDYPDKPTSTGLGSQLYKCSYEIFSLAKNVDQSKYGATYVRVGNISRINILTKLKSFFDREMESSDRPNLSAIKSEIFAVAKQNIQTKNKEKS